jgi:hypothetical protein
MPRWLVALVWVVAAALALDVLLAMTLGFRPLSLGVLTLPARRMQLEVTLSAVLAAVAVLSRPASPSRLPWVVGLLTLGVLHANTRSMGSADTTATASLPFMLVREGTVTFDAASWLHERPGPGGAYYLRRVDEHLLAFYPLATGVLATPFYLPALLGRFDPTVDPVADLEKFAASSLTALGAVLLFLALRRWVREGVALLTIACWVLGTAVSPVLGQALWQHTGAAFCLSFGWWALATLAPSARRAVLVGLAAGVAGACRPLDLLLGAAVVAVLWSEGWRRVAWAGLGASVPLALFAAYNTWAFGRPWSTGYGAVSTEGFAGNWPVGLVGLLFSPGRGLFVLSPLLLWAVVPLARRAPTLLVGCALQVAIYARWTWWDGGFGPGQRYLSDLLPLLAPGLALGFEAVVDHGSRARRWLLGVAVAWSLVVNGLLTWALPEPATKDLIWMLSEGPFSVRSFPPVAYVIGWVERARSP